MSSVCRLYNGIRKTHKTTALNHFQQFLYIFLASLFSALFSANSNKGKVMIVGALLGAWSCLGFASRVAKAIAARSAAGSAGGLACSFASSFIGLHDEDEAETEGGADR